MSEQQKCPKCGGRGKVNISQPPSSPWLGTCLACEGTGVKRGTTTAKAVGVQRMDMPLTVILGVQGGWWTAICPELMVSGMGDDPHKAMEAVGRSIHSTLTALMEKGHIDKVSQPAERTLKND